MVAHLQIVLPLNEVICIMVLMMDSLQNGFVLFGDNAHLNSSYMVTPYPNVSGSVPEQRNKDNYIFYHSQHCIWLSALFACLFRDGEPA